MPRACRDGWSSGRSPLPADRKRTQRNSNNSCPTCSLHVALPIGSPASCLLPLWRTRQAHATRADHAMPRSADPRPRPEWPVNPDIVGWAASAVLLVTLSRQIYTQWQDKDAKGVSRWLFVGQIAASCGFIAYSWLLDNLVFIVTNSLILLTAVVGEVGLLVRRRGMSVG